MTDMIYIQKTLASPHLFYDLWWAAILIPMAAGSAVTLSAGGTPLGRRIVQAAVCGVLIGLGYAMAHSWIDGWQGIKTLTMYTLWRVFVFVIFATISAVLTELKLPEPSGTFPTGRLGE